MASRDKEEKVDGGEAIAAAESGTYAPGADQDDGNKEKPEGETDWHNFESQYSLALAQSAIVEREKWGSNIEFLLSCISSAVGLGNIWRFPFVCGKNGGGAFLIPYFIVVCVIGRPLYYLELLLGQFSSRGSVKVWEMAPILRGVGYGTGIASFMVSTFYVTIMAWTLLYGMYSFYPKLPWKDKKYRDTEDFFEIRHFKDERINSSNGNYLKYQRMFVEGKGLGPPSWEQMLALLLAWIILWFALVKGVSGSGKVAYFTALFPYFVLIILLIVGCTLEGSLEGIEFFVKPEWKALYDPQTWFEAVGQCFFSLGVGFGGCIMFSSFNHFNHNLNRDVLIISIVDTLTSFLAGITIFSILGNLAHETGQDIRDIAKAAGPGLAFISYPQAMNENWGYPAAQILSFLFFTMLLTLGIGSATALVGTTTTIFQDAFPNVKKWIIVSVNCLLGFIGGIIYTTPAGANIIDIVNDYGATFVIYVFAFVEICGIVFLYGLKNFQNDIEFMVGRKVGIYWTVCWVLLSPLLLFILTFHLATFKPNNKWHISAQVASWIMTLIILTVPIIFGIHAVQTKKSSSFFKRFRASLVPTKRWGPKDPIMKEAWRRFKRTKNPEFPWTVKIKKVLGISPIQAPMSVVPSQALPIEDQTATQSNIGSEYPTEVTIGSESNKNQ